MYKNVVFKGVGKTTRPRPRYGYFFINTDCVELSKKQCIVLGVVTLLARRLILLNWKQKNVLCPD